VLNYKRKNLTEYDQDIQEARQLLDKNGRIMDFLDRVMGAQSFHKNMEVLGTYSDYMSKMFK
jgi:hypothetical protein